MTTKKDYVEGLKRAKKLIIENRWTFAKTMSNIPHWYTVRKNWSDDYDFLWFYNFVNEYGYKKKFFSKIYTYIDIEGFQYWSLPDKEGNPVVVNRTRFGNCYFIKFENIKSLTEEAKNDNISIIESKNIQYIGFYYDKKLVGVTSYHRNKVESLTGKTFVLKDFRGKGIAYELVFFMIKQLQEKSRIKSLTAACRENSLNIYLNVGFKEVGKYKNGETKVVYNFER